MPISNKIRKKSESKTVNLFSYVNKFYYTGHIDKFPPLYAHFCKKYVILELLVYQITKLILLVHTAKKKLILF